MCIDVLLSILENASGNEFRATKVKFFSINNFKFNIEWSVSINLWLNFNQYSIDDFLDTLKETANHDTRKFCQNFFFT